MKLWMDISGTPEYREGAAGYARQNPSSGPGSGVGDAENLKKTVLRNYERLHSVVCSMVCCSDRKIPPSFGLVVPGFPAVTGKYLHPVV
jgi:hypothetical protein